MTPEERCAACVFGRSGPPLDCLIVPPDQKYRSLMVVGRRWSAECEQFEPRPTKDDLAWAWAILDSGSESKWARRVIDRVRFNRADTTAELEQIMVESIRQRGVAGA